MKALVKELGFPCIYVKSFDLPNNAYPQAGINAVFARARQTTPCFLVLEDLDALVGDHNRSFFLNELDGFASNAGIVTLATSNHAERLDPSILERPSRFDRKYHFDLPQQSERVQYVTYWNGVLAPQLTLNDDEAQQIAEQTDGFSFAYIKELFLSAMMRWASSHQSERFGAIALEQIEALRAQMSTVSADAPEAAAPAPWFPFPPHIMRMMAMRGFPGGD
jgi:AAA+ superfamily predicted ATPase